MRCAMPYKLAEDCYPGTVDEKVGGELGAYAWMQAYCRDIPLAFLHGIGFLDGRQVLLRILLCLDYLLS